MTLKNTNPWYWQWSRFSDENRELFERWIAPAKFSDFKQKDVLECGCGGGQHSAWMAEVAKSVTAVDLYTIDIAKKRNAHIKNITFIEDDISTIDLNRQFDIVISIGVIHHTVDMEQTFENLYRHLLPKGTLIIWVYAAEGNFLMRFGLGPLQWLIIRYLPKKLVELLARLITILLYLPIYSIYLIPLARNFPYFEYFKDFRALSFERNVLNVFDKMNAPITHFASLEQCQNWFNDRRFEKESCSIRHHAGVSYSLIGTKLAEPLESSDKIR